MKKFLTLVLALVLALGLSVPAMAFTSDDSDDVDHPYDLSIYLVEYDDNDLFGMVALPESDRGYAKNEIVAAVVELFVPKGEDVADDNYDTLVFGGDNVDLDVTDNYDAGSIDLEVSSSVNGSDATTTIAAALNSDDEIEITFTELAGKNTFKWLFFAKVTGDDASLYAKLIDGTSAEDFDDNNPINLTLSGDDYTVERTAPAVGETDFTYVITAVTGDYAGATITIDVDKNNKSKGMSLNDGTYDFALGVNTNGELGLVKGAVIDTNGDDYDDLMDLYEDVVVDVFGLDYFLIGNYVRDSFFEGLVSADTIVATVDIEPWTAYVTVPDNIVVDPPKTGDAASIMGFVMVALSGAGAVALKKRG
ncbi:MAG: hypothetical protein AAGU32_00175 [Bacillota bacterium]